MVDMIPVKAYSDSAFFTRWFDKDSSEHYQGEGSSDEHLYHTKTNRWVLFTEKDSYVIVAQEVAVCWMIDNNHEDKLPKELLSKYEI